MQADDWTFCRDSLEKVSRTFSRPIAMLEGELEVAVTCGYLLCRIVDTIEDEADLAVGEKDALYASFLAAVQGELAPEEFSRQFAQRLPAEGDPERILASDLGAVMRVFGSLRQPLQDGVRRWVCEMGRGMNIYTHRVQGRDGLVALWTLTDLERYCYFVAGTVGHMLTELFLEARDGWTPARLRTMRANAEEFGLGLQLTNILKDITDDRERGWSFIPRTVCEAEGLEVTDLTEPGKRALAHSALRPVFDRARRALEGAFEYCLAIPPKHRDVRLFCLLPLWMAVATLHHARGNDAQFVRGEPVKITRAEVESLIADCVARCGDDDALREGWARLNGRPTALRESAVRASA